MNSAERHEARYQRRKKKREEKRRMQSLLYGNLEDVFSFENLYEAGLKCMKGVTWKTSAQNYKKKIFSYTYELYKKIQNEDIRKIANSCMEIYGNIGFGLGAHTSQIYTNVAVTPLDHYMKSQLRVKCYGRYVDDFYFFTKDLDEAKDLLAKVRVKVKELGLMLNDKKTKIQRFSHGFKFLKTKFFCTSSGKIVKKINRDSPVRMRRKLKIFEKWVKECKFTIDQTLNAYFSWRGYASSKNCYKVLRRMDLYVLKLFQNYNLKPKMAIKLARSII